MKMNSLMLQILDALRYIFSYCWIISKAKNFSLNDSDLLDWNTITYFCYFKASWRGFTMSMTIFNVSISGLLLCHVLNREFTDISIMSEMSAVGAGVRACPYWEKVDEAGGWWGPRNLHHWSSLAAMSRWSISGWLSSQVFILWGQGVASKGT